MAKPEREEWYYGRDSRAVTIERLRRWVEIAVKEGLSTRMLDQSAHHLAMFLAMEAEDRGKMKWLRRWEAEVNGDGPPEKGVGNTPRNGHY